MRHKISRHTVSGDVQLCPVFKVLSSLERDVATEHVPALYRDILSRHFIASDGMHVMNC